MTRFACVLLVSCSIARAEEGKQVCADGLPGLGSSRLASVPALDEPTEEALTAWRDDLLVRYQNCGLAPFDPRRPDLAAHQEAYSADLHRRVGQYRIKLDGGASANLTRALEIFGVEMTGPVDKAVEILAGLRAMQPWPVRSSGQVVAGCRLELARTRRAELCLEVDGMERKEANVVGTQVRALVVCPTPLVTEDIALVWLSPIAPPAMNKVTTRRTTEAIASFLHEFTQEEAAVRALGCDESKRWCVGMTESGALALTHGGAATSVAAEDLSGFELVGSASRWSGIEHLPSGLTIARSTIGTIYGLPTGGLSHFWLSSGDCMIWRNHLGKSTSTGPMPVDLHTLCLLDGAWVDGAHAAVSVRGTVRQVVQNAIIDDLPTRCSYAPPEAQQ